LATYSDATDTIQPIVDELIEAYYPDLVEASVTIGGLFAHRDAGKFFTPALTHGGRKVLYRVKINSEADRVEGKTDATIFIDYEEWDTHTDNWTAKNANDESLPTGKAILTAGIDECLFSLHVRRDKKTGQTMTDDHGRAKLKVKKFDWTFTGFRAIADRHKSASYEVREARQLHDAYGNILFNFAEDLAVQGELPGVETVKPKRRPRAGVVAASNR
jgi:hypothetical protein